MVWAEQQDGDRGVPGHWEQPLTELDDPGDIQGIRWERPPVGHRNVPDVPPAGRPPVIAVIGSSGFKASWQTGILDVLAEIADPVRLDLASGGTVPGLAVAAGLNRHWCRIASAGVPSQKILRPLEGLRWFERRNLDAGGIYDIGEVETWLVRWLEFAGVRTFRDLRYGPDEPKPAGVEHRAGICVSMWRTKEPYPSRCTEEQLRDPAFVRRAYRWAFYGRQFPWRRFRSVWVPDTIGDHLPWLKDEIDDHSPAWWARVSMSQWPACLPTVLQDPRTRHLVFLIDGGHIDNQPSLFNDGRRHEFPLINPRLMQNRRQANEAQGRVDARRVPFGKVVRFPVTPETDIGSLEGHDLDWVKRDAMWRRGVLQGRDQLPGALAELVGRHAALTTRPRLDVEVPALHGFQAIATARRPGTRRTLGLRS
jgi:hypothetical protein